MNKLHSVLAAGVATLMMGCPARSLNPLFTEDDLQFLPELIGSWADLESQEDIVMFDQSGENSYTLIVAEKSGERVTYNVQTGQIGTSWFLDSSPSRGGGDFHFISTHVLSQFWLNGDTLKIANLEGDWIRARIGEKNLGIAHVRRGNDIILTATTDELRALVLRYAEDADAFPDPIIMIRKK